MSEGSTMIDPGIQERSSRPQPSQSSRYCQPCLRWLESTTQWTEKAGCPSVSRTGRGGLEEGTTSWSEEVSLDTERWWEVETDCWWTYYSFNFIGTDKTGGEFVGQGFERDITCRKPNLSGWILWGRCSLAVSTASVLFCSVSESGDGPVPDISAVADAMLYWSHGDLLFVWWKKWWLIA